MPVTIQQIRAELDPEEPNYDRAKALGSGALAGLRQLVMSPDPMLASKAAYLAGLIDSAQSVGVLQTAANRPHLIVRIAAAAAVRSLSAERATKLLRVVLRDADTGVRRVALDSIRKEVAPAVVPRLKAMADGDQDPSIRDLATEVLARITVRGRARRRRTRSAKKPKRRS